MSFFKVIFSKTGSKVWFFVTTSILVLLIVVTSLASTIFYELFCTLWGRERMITKDGTQQIFIADFDTKEEARLNGERVNERITEEGFVLLKNDSNTLPLPKGAKISVFGKNSVNLVYGGSGSGAGSGEFTKTIFESLTAAGFSYNPTLKSFYESSDSGSGRSSNPAMENDGSISLKVGETPQSSYTQSVKNSYRDYDDAALIVLSRIGGEGWDLPRKMVDKNGNLVEGARDANDHYLQLDQNETDLIKAVCDEFEKVIVIINSSSPIELGFLDDPEHYAYHENIGAAIWIGAPGDTGIMSLGRILNGDVNPSGRIPDTYARDFKKDPTWFNFGNNLIPNGQDYLSVKDKKTTYIYSYVDYEEGIYVGYRYYETRGFTDGETWYNENVVFPFGYGLSYTTFSQEIANKQTLQNTTITADKKIQVNVKVTNTGSVAGKDVVQLYVTPPYIEGGIEKSHVVLAGFAKTGIIQPGASETVTVEIDPYYFASYDYNDKNQNGFKGYELESGKYIIRLCANAHEQIDSFEATVQEPGIKYETDPVTGYSVVNRFDDIDDELGSILSRTDWKGTFPATRTTQERELDALTNQKINSIATNNPFQTNEFPIIGEENDVTLRDLVGKDYDDPLWDELLNRLKVNDMINLFNNGAFQTAAIMEIGKPRTNDADGPAGFVNFMSDPSVGAVYGTSHYACEPIMAATWNVDLLFDFGEAIGNEALIGDERGDGTPYSGWYAPGINLHRSPFGGRAGEYFSEDSFLSGMLAAYEIQGAMSKGVYTQVKHFAVNEQETSRRGICTWLDEQTLREIYLRPFEMAVKIGKTRGMMSSFNRIGAKWTGGDYRLLTEVLRNEWGFRGMVICDFNTGSHMDSRQMAYAGGDLNLQTFNQEWKPKISNPTDMTILRERVKNILYTVCNSNAMNSEVLGYKPPVWMVLMFIIDAVVVAGLGLWGFFAIRKAYKAQKQKTS